MIIFTRHGLELTAIETSKIGGFYHLEEEGMKANHNSRDGSLKNQPTNKNCRNLALFQCMFSAQTLPYVPLNSEIIYALILREGERKIHLK